MRFMAMSKIFGGLQSMAGNPAVRGLRTYRPGAKTRILVSGALLLASGCTPWREYIRNGFKVGPNFCEPEAPVAAQWIDAHDSRLQPAREHQPRWWNVF